MGQTDITLRQLQCIMRTKEELEVYEHIPGSTDGGAGGSIFSGMDYRDLYTGRAEGIPEGLLDRAVFVMWARSEKETNGTTMIQLREEGTP